VRHLVKSIDVGERFVCAAAGGFVARCQLRVSLDTPVARGTNMKTIVSNRGSTQRSGSSAISFGILALSVLVAVPTFLIVRLIDPALILPVLSIVLFAGAAIAVVVARSVHSDRDSGHVTLWDIAGAFTLMGCAAAIFSEPDQVAQFFEQLAERDRVKQ
jgi:hypothetical protein